MRRLRVFLYTDLVGVLEQRPGGGMRFAYDGDWLARADAVSLSHSLPLQSDAFPDKKVRPFFAGVLPEEGPRRKIAAILGVSASNDFALLEALGGECAGAVSVLPEDSIFPEAATGDARQLTEAELEAAVMELPKRPLLAGKDGVRLSLAGAQDKLPLIYENGQFWLPVGMAASTHILKPEPERFPGLATNEAFCMTLAKLCRIAVPSVTLYPVAGKPCVLVARYDRKADVDGVVRRLHQEDFCQALGLPPEQKYQSEGGPTIKTCVSLLRQWSTAPVLDIRDFLDGVVFNAVIGNADAHGKNYALLYEGDQRRLAPFYDLVSTVVWEELSKKFAMAVGGCKHVNALTATHWRKMAEKAELGWPMVHTRVSELAKTVLENLLLAAASLPEADAAMVDSLIENIEARAQRIVGML